MQYLSNSNNLSHLYLLFLCFDFIFLSGNFSYWPVTNLSHLCQASKANIHAPWFPSSGFLLNKKQRRKKLKWKRCTWPYLPRNQVGDLRHAHVAKEQPHQPLLPPLHPEAPLKVGCVLNRPKQQFIREVLGHIWGRTQTPINKTTARKGQCEFKCYKMALTQHFQSLPHHTHTHTHTHLLVHFPPAWLVSKAFVKADPHPHPRTFCGTETITNPML